MSRCSRGSAGTAGPKRRRGVVSTYCENACNVRTQTGPHSQKRPHHCPASRPLFDYSSPHCIFSLQTLLPPTATHCHPLLHIGCHPRLTPIPPSRSAAASGSCCRKSARRGRRKAPETRRPSRPRPRPHPPRPRLLRTQGRYHLLLPPPPPPLLQAHSRGAHRKIRV